MLHYDTSQTVEFALRPCAATPGAKRYAIIGGGFAGVATAHSLAATASAVNPVVIHLYDLAGLVSKLVVSSCPASWQHALHDEVLHTSMCAYQYKLCVYTEHTATQFCVQQLAMHISYVTALPSNVH